MKKTFILLCFNLFCSLLIFSQSRTITGTVLTEVNEPIGFANVVLRTAQDSSYIIGNITNEKGEFMLEVKNRSNENLVLTVSYLGYKTKAMAVTSDQIGKIILDNRGEALGEVVVTASRNPYQMKGSILVADVSNTILKDAGTSVDLLKSLPLLDVMGSAIHVFGKGDAIVYINNRKIQDQSELERLNSAQIKNVEIITSPGAQYAATTSAVVKITTLKREDDGLAGSIYTHIQKGRKWSEGVNANFTYTQNKVSAFADFSFFDSRTKQDQETGSYIFSKDEYRTIAGSDLQMKNRSFHTGLGLDYLLAENHTMGVKYNFSFVGKRKFDVSSDLNFYTNGILDEQLINNGYYTPDGENGYLNAYYNGEMGKASLSINADYSHGNTSTDANYINIYDDRTERLSSYSDNKYQLAAVKFDLGYQMGKGKGVLGTEYSFTKNTSGYENNGENIQEDLPHSLTKNEQNALALYASYQIGLGNFEIDAGVRYEYINFNYFLNGTKKEDQSKTYNDIFPVVTVSGAFADNQVNMSLSYRRTTNRPSYYQLRGDVQYNSPYSYEGGNPALKNAFKNDLSYMISYRTFNLIASYKFFKDQSFFITEQFNDKPITLSTFVNIDDYKEFSLSAIWNPTFFKIWNPRVEVGFEKHYLKTDYENQIKRYNDPIVHARLYNTLRFPKDFSFVIQARIRNSYNSGFTYQKSSWSVNAHIQKQFLNKSLTATLGANNIFNTLKEEWEMDYKNVHLYKNMNDDNRYIYLSLSYNFSKLKRYKGKGAANAERNRLNAF